MMKLEKIYIVTAKNFCNLSISQIIKILLILFNIYIVFKDENKLMFYIPNYID